MKIKEFMNKYKVQILFFPFFMLYVILIYMALGMGDDIWDGGIKKLKNKGL